MADISAVSLESILAPAKSFGRDNWAKHDKKFIHGEIVRKHTFRLRFHNQQGIASFACCGTSAGKIRISGLGSRQT